MSGFFSNRRLLTGAVLAATTLLGTGLFAQPTPSAATAPSTAPAPDMPSDPNAPIATIGGTALDNKAFYNILMQVAGMRVFQQVYDLVIVQNQCRINQIPTSGPEFEKHMGEEYERMLNSITFPADVDPKTIDRAKREQALVAMLNQRGTTQVEFRMLLERNCELRLLAAGKITVSDAELKQAYQAEYGEKRTIRLIPVSSDKQAAEVRDLIEKKGKSVDDAVKEAGLGQAGTWTISQTAQDLGDVYKAAFGPSAKEKYLSAQVSLPPQTGAVGNVLVYVDKIDPDRTSKVSQASVEADLKKKVYDIKETNWMNNYMANLHNDALPTLKINEKFLKYQFDMQMAQVQEAMRQAAAAASQPAGASMSTPASAPASGVPMPAAPAGRGGASTAPMPLPGK